MAFLRIFLLTLALWVPLQLSAQNKSNLMLACKIGSCDLVKFYLQQYDNVNCTDGRGVTPLMYAAEFDNDSLCELLLQYGANPNAKAHVNGVIPPVTIAVIHNNPRLLDIMLQFGGNPNLLDNANFLTPIHYAVREGYLECADVLLFHGAHPNKVCRNKSPLQIAAFYCDTLMSELLLQHGGNINNQHSGISPLCIAVQRNDTLMAAWLIRHGADVNEVCRLGAPIVYSAIYADEKMSKLLCDNGADVNTVSSSGQNTATLSLMSGNISNKRYFEGNGVKSQKLILGSVSASYCHEFCNHDYRMGLRVGFHESHFNIGLSAAFFYRHRTRTSILAKEYDDFATSRTRLSIAEVGIEKRMSFRHQRLPDFGGYVGCYGSYCMANTKDLTPKVKDKRLRFTPAFGLYQRFTSVGFSAGYKCYSSDYGFNAPKHLAEIAFSVYLNANRRGLGKFNMY